MKLLSFEDFLNEGLSHAEVRKIEKFLSQKDKEALKQAIEDGTIKTSGDLKSWKEEMNISEEDLNESGVSNDPILMAYRAKQMDREKEMKLALQKKKDFKKMKSITKRLDKISDNLISAHEDRNEILIEMDREAGSMGLEEFEKSGLHNEYGQKLNKIDDKITSLMKKRRALEMQLAELNI